MAAVLNEFIALLHILAFVCDAAATVTNRAVRAAVRNYKHLLSYISRRF